MSSLVSPLSKGVGRDLSCIGPGSTAWPAHQVDPTGAGGIEIQRDQATTAEAPCKIAVCPTAAQRTRNEYYLLDQLLLEREKNGVEDPPAQGKCNGCRRVHNVLDIQCTFCVMPVPRTPDEAIISRGCFRTWIHVHASPECSSTWGQTKAGVTAYAPWCFNEIFSCICPQIVGLTPHGHHRAHHSFGEFIRSWTTGRMGPPWGPHSPGPG